MVCLLRISVERAKKEHLIKPQGLRGKMPTTITCPYITHLRYALLVKDLSGKGEAENPNRSLVPISSFPVWICSYFELKGTVQREGSGRN